MARTSGAMTSSRSTAVTPTGCRAAVPTYEVRDDRGGDGVATLAGLGAGRSGTAGAREVRSWAPPARAPCCPPSPRTRRKGKKTRIRTRLLTFPTWSTMRLVEGSKIKNPLLPPAALVSAQTFNVQGIGREGERQRGRQGERPSRTLKFHGLARLHGASIGLLRAPTGRRRPARAPWRLSAGRAAARKLASRTTCSQRGNAHFPTRIKATRHPTPPGRGSNSPRGVPP